MENFSESYISILTIFIYIGAFNGFLFALILASYKNGNKKANKFFALILLVLAFRLTELSLLISGELWRIPFLSGVTYPLLFLIGPLFWLYTKRLWHDSYPLKWIHLLMLIPTFWALWDASEWIFTNPTTKAEFLKNFQPWLQQDITTKQFVKFGVLIVHTAVYLVFVIKDLDSYKKLIHSTTSNNNYKNKLQWLKKVTVALFLYVVGFFLTMVLLATTETYGLLVDRTWIVAYSLFIHAVGFVAIQQPHFFKDQLEQSRLNGNSLSKLSEVGKYKNSPLEDEKANEYYSHLLHLMEKEKFFLKEDLKASEIAEELDIPSYQLSHLLLLKSEYNFLDLVNKYRVAEAKKLLLDPKNDHLTILAVGLESGFNNKSSFHRAFKKFTGQTPSKFKQQRESKMLS